ncbi:MULTISPECIES: hypothetical protein [unclassified Leucobacter]|uniref:hypothetical protein n=1 Tax=unclassified Leucobacter TaxID=2621730 RepID=UPI00165E06B5|nr:MULTISPECIES: hypothetical protein [unclassified Leucobacter]MBC9928396.1 hypothetical protein [Leucobacter sp. cx-169]
MRRVLMMMLVAGLVMVGPASAASATQGPAARVAVEDIPRNPLGNLRDYMLTVTKQFLGIPNPGSDVVNPRDLAYARAKVQGASPAKLAKWMEYSMLNSPTNAAMTAQDYFDRNHDWQTPITTDPKTGEKKLKVQATKPGNFKKLANGSIQVIAASTFIPVIGNAGSNLVGGWMGFEDVNSEWCEATADPQGFFDTAFSSVFGLLSGRDCSMFGLADDYTPNGDVDGKQWGDMTLGAVKIGYFGSALKDGRTYYCYTQNQNLPAGKYFFDKNGKGKGASIWHTTGTPGSTICKTAFPAYTGDKYAYSPIDAVFAQITDPSSWYVAASAGVPEADRQTMVENEQDPERVLECVITMTDGTVVKSEGGSYRESDGQISPPACPAVPEGKVPDSISVGEKDGQKLYDEPVTPEYKDWATKYPECGEGACLLDLSVKSGTKLGVSCFTIPEPCVDWWTDPNRADNFQCTYGAHALDDEECAVYAGIFKPGRVQVGAPYSDPMTGEWNGGSSAPRLDGQAMSQGIQNPASTRACTGLNTTGFDPVAFVMRPVQCALEWAFVPRPLVVEVELSGGEVAWEKKPPAVIAGIVGNFSLAPSASGCSKSVTIFSGQFQQSITPIDACAGSTLAPVATISRVVTSAGMVVLVIVVLRRQVAGMIGYGSGQ